MAAGVLAAPEAAPEVPPDLAALPGPDDAERPDVMPDIQAAPALPEMALAVPEDGVPLDAVRVTVRAGGTAVHPLPDRSREPLGRLPEGESVPAQAAVLRDWTWLQTVWANGGDSPAEGWIVGEETDFARSHAYGQVVEAWPESAPVMTYRKALVRDLLRARGVEQAKIDRVDSMRAEALSKFEDLLTRQTVPPEYIEFWRAQDRLRLPDPFTVLPVHPLPPQALQSLEIQGFGPTTFAFEQWAAHYTGTRGLHTGLDYLVAEGSPLIALADGVIVDFPLMADPNERWLALRPFLPDRLRRPDGSRALSNVIVAYGHLTGDPSSALVRPGDQVRAGQVIGTSGWPVYTDDAGRTQIQYNNAHLHLEIHLVSDGDQALGSRQPFNPLLFFTPRLVAFQARLAEHSPAPPYPKTGHSFGRLGFFALGCFRSDLPTVVWEAGPTWPEGVVPLARLMEMLRTMAPGRGAD